MKVFVVNLARSKDRLARVTARLAALGVDWERFEAVDDAGLSPAARARAWSAFGWWCCTLVAPVRGQIGCALSHQGVYRKMLAENLNAACVLEDDVILDDRFPAVLAGVEARLDPVRAQVILLSDHDRGPCTEAAEVTLEPAIWDWCAEGYVLTLPAARALLRDNAPLRVMNDMWERWVNQGVIALYHARPTVCSQRSYDHPEESEIVRAFHIADRPFGERMVWKLKRAVGIALDALSSPRRFRGRVVQIVRRLHVMRGG